MPNAAFLKLVGTTLFIGTLLVLLSGLLWPTAIAPPLSLILLHLLFAAIILMTMGRAVSNHPKLSVGDQQVPLALSVGGAALLVILGAWSAQLIPLSVGTAFAYQALVMLLIGRHRNRAVT